MSWRGVYISQEARLSLHQSQLVIGDKGSVPLEDVDYIILDTQQVTITGGLLSACAERGCAIITTDEKHMPNGVVLGFHPYHRQAETLGAQLGLSTPRKKRLWQQLIKSKIINQASCLRLAGCTADQADKVHLCSQKVQSGDVNNMEATAARFYWQMFAPGFIRHSDEDDRLNAMLNYGYAIVRSLLARDLAALGFIACMGIHHSNLQNAFNLADDVMEPWRPFVDHVALCLWREDPQGGILRTVDKQKLVELLHYDVFYDAGVCNIMAGCKLYVKRIRAYMMGQTDHVACPTFLLTQGALCQPKEPDTCG